ncbi:nucleolar protein 3 [Thalassophryne amazonica]|uniref:nucleolar protein 3 n=1 Tax=Thalassophryne amazonica TaxID=390379 RepID=UPI0014715D56|nr:nucleolar protein 3 [Thalassophryne amazonica]
MTTEWMTSDMFIVAVVVLVLVLLFLLVLCWLIGHSSRRDLVEIQISTGKPGSTLIIRTRQDHADELLQRLMDQINEMEEGEPGTGAETDPKVESDTEEEPDPEMEPDPGEEPELEGEAEPEELQSPETYSLAPAVWIEI